MSNSFLNFLHQKVRFSVKKCHTRLTRNSALLIKEHVIGGLYSIGKVHQIGANIHGPNAALEGRNQGLPLRPPRIVLVKSGPFQGHPSDKGGRLRYGLVDDAVV